MRAGAAGMAHDWDEFRRFENDWKDPVFGIYYETTF
jgi:hypothetical protein